MMDKIEMSLDEIIKSTKGPRQQKGRPGMKKRGPLGVKRGRQAGGRIQKRGGGGGGGVGRTRFPRVSV